MNEMEISIPYFNIWARISTQFTLQNTYTYILI